MAITKEQIFQAADKLVADGVNPTLAGVRAEIGGGSYATINPFLQEWKAQQKAASSSPREPVPEAIASRLLDVGAEIWKAALGMANARFAAEREAMEAICQRMEDAQQESTELADQLSVELEALQARHKQALAQLEQECQENAALSRQVAISEARAAETSRRADDLKAGLQHAHSLQECHATEIQQLGARLNQAQADREQALQATSQSREEAARLSGELEAFRSMLGQKTHE